MKSYAAYYEKDILWLPSEEFSATMKLRLLERGKSAVIFWWERTFDNARFPMFASEIFDLAQYNGICPGGVVSGRWGFTKRGDNYSIYFIG